jgi:hypothetical protein
MADYAISSADLSGIFNELSTINGNVATVHSNVGVLSNMQRALVNKQITLEAELLQLMESFADFVEADAKQNNLHLAETRFGNLRQELQIKYGYYAEIRRMATGILQGVDTGIVGNETLQTATEEVMIKAPGYWLAPALVSLASWIRDNKATCDKALVECLKRDDYKTTLFFMLLTRRMGRNEATLTWLERYFIHQNPQDLDREFITILEAVTTGVFLPASRTVMMKYVKNWLDLLTQGGRFIDEQKHQWMKYFDGSKPSLQEDKYPLLKLFAKNWTMLENALREAKTQDILYNYFKSIISSSYDFSSSLKLKLDEILTQLVTNFDDEELPLQKQIRLNQLIIEKEGDKKNAQAVMDAEENIFKEKVDFLQMLTNAAFNPEASGVTKVTQALAVSISQPWIIEAHDTFTAQSRNRFPKTGELAIDGFTTITRDGSDEQEQLSKQESFYAQNLERELTAIVFPTGGVAIGVLIGIAGFILTSSIDFVGGLISVPIGGIMIWNNINNVNKKKEQVRTTFEERTRKAKGALKGCLAEMVDLRKELTMEDSKAEIVRQLLNSITPQDFSSVSQETARNIILK